MLVRLLTGKALKFHFDWKAFREETIKADTSKLLITFLQIQVICSFKSIEQEAPVNEI